MLYNFSHFVLNPKSELSNSIKANVSWKQKQIQKNRFQNLVYSLIDTANCLILSTGAQVF